MRSRHSRGMPWPHPERDAHGLPMDREDVTVHRSRHEPCRVIPCARRWRPSSRSVSCGSATPRGRSTTCSCWSAPSKLAPDTAMRHVYFDAVRRSLTDQIVAAYVRRSGIRISPFAQHMAAGALGIADPVVKKLVSPEALSEMLAAGWPVAAVREPPPPGTLGITMSTVGTFWQIFRDRNTASTGTKCRRRRRCRGRSALVLRSGYCSGAGDWSGHPPRIFGTCSLMSSSRRCERRRKNRDSQACIPGTAQPNSLAVRRSQALARACARRGGRRGRTCQPRAGALSSGRENCRAMTSATDQHPYPMSVTSHRTINTPANRSTMSGSVTMPDQVHCVLLSGSEP